MKPAKHLPNFRRAYWIYAVFAVSILLTGPSDLLVLTRWQRQEPADLLTLALSTLVGGLLGWSFSRDIWNLVVRRNPLWKELFFGTVTLAVLLALILLREFGVWLWPLAAGDALALSLLATMAFVTFLTERTKRVRVYAFAGHFAFETKSTDT